jgi:hypothetical protein
VKYVPVRVVELYCLRVVSFVLQDRGNPGQASVGTFWSGSHGMHHCAVSLPLAQPAFRPTNLREETVLQKVVVVVV